MIIIIYLHMINFQESEITDSNFAKIQRLEKYNSFGLGLKNNLHQLKRSLNLKR